MEDDKEDRDCAFCRLDRVGAVDIPRCLMLSFAGAWRDTPRIGIIDALAKDDRVLYFVGLLIAMLAIRLVVTA